jgi:ribokinase
VHVVHGTPTGRAFITVDEDGGNAIVVSPGANAQLTEGAVSAGLRDMDRGDILLLQLETPEALVRYAARTAAEVGGLVVLNTAPVPESLDGLFDHVDVLIVNEHELTGISRLLAGQRGGDMARVAAASDASVICTAGSEGAYVMDGTHTEHIVAPTVDAVDTTAAGDTFIGYLGAGLAEDPSDLLSAAEIAVRAAALAVTREGAIDSIPFRTKGHV